MKNSAPSRCSCSTTKPVLYVCNVDDTSAADGKQCVEQVREAIKGEDAELIIISHRPRPTLPNWKPMKKANVPRRPRPEYGCNRLIKAIYSLRTSKRSSPWAKWKVKAWTYRKGWKALQCAGVIHTDFERFIRAEVIK